MCGWWVGGLWDYTVISWAGGTLYFPFPFTFSQFLFPFTIPNPSPQPPSPIPDPGPGPVPVAWQFWMKQAFELYLSNMNISWLMSDIQLISTTTQQVGVKLPGSKNCLCLISWRPQGKRLERCHDINRRNNQAGSISSSARTLRF